MGEIKTGQPITRAKLIDMIAFELLQMSNCTISGEPELKIEGMLFGIDLANYTFDFQLEYIRLLIKDMSNSQLKKVLTDNEIDMFIPAIIE